MNTEMKEQCPSCGSTRIAKIVWGLPDFTEELIKKLDDGKIVLGGCMPGGADYECKVCGKRFRSESSRMDRSL